MSWLRQDGTPGTTQGPLTAEDLERMRAELPYDAWRLSDGESALPTRHVDLDGRGATRR